MRVIPKRILLLAVWFMFLLVTPVCYAVQSGQEMTFSDPIWRLVAQSDLIIEGKLVLPREEIVQSLSANSPKYVELRILVHNVYKGKLGEAPEVLFSYYVEERDNNPSPKTLLAIEQKEVIVALAKSSDPKKIYFAGHTPLALRLSGPTDGALFKNEVARQKQIIEDFPQLFPSSEAALFEDVRRLIDDLPVDKYKQEENFRKLEELGNAAVPAIILQMDDWRVLAVKHIAFANKSPDAVEGMRHYSPECVVDGLSAVLTQITKESFSDIYNGGGRLDRKRDINGWKVYLYYLNKSKQKK